jgi:hypothetical protein
MHTASVPQPLKSIILPGAICLLERETRVGKNVWVLSAEALAYTDRALLNWCDYSPQLGGHVERLSDGVRVTVYTD